MAENTYITATQLFNYFLNDTLSDYLNLNGQVLGFKEDSCPFGTQTILNKGHLFEEKVVDKIREKEIEVIRVIEYDDWNIGADETFNLMKAGYPIIYQGYLINRENQTRGRPDILIRADILNQLKDNIITDDDIKMRSIFGDESGRWHYRVIDIKMSNILLTKNGERILNCNLYNAYKAQVLVYNMALGLLQGYQPEYGYLLGRSSRNYNNTITYDDCFSSLTIIDYTGYDKMIINKLSSALEWYKLLKDLPLLEKNQETGKWDWESLEKSLPEHFKFNLRPNMKNKYNYKWVTEYDKIAKEREELTLLWNCGFKKRNDLMLNGVNNFTDYLLYLKNKEGYIDTTLRSMLNINVNPKCDRVVLPDKMDKQFRSYLPAKNKPFLVLDFELINNLVDDFENLPDKYGHNLIFLIGITMYFPMGQYKYFPFMVRQINEDEEFRIVSKMLKFIRDILDSTKEESIILYHWSPAEVSFFNNMIERQWEFFDEIDKETIERIEFYDVLTIFKYYPIVIKGAYNFSLKTIGNALYNLGLIKTIWDDNNYMDGFSVMMKVDQYSREADKININLSDFKEIDDVIKYNMIDCTVLAEIMVFLQNKYLKN